MAACRQIFHDPLVHALAQGGEVGADSAAGEAGTAKDRDDYRQGLPKSATVRGMGIVTQSRQDIAKQTGCGSKAHFLHEHEQTEQEGLQPHTASPFAVFHGVRQ